MNNLELLKGALLEAGAKPTGDEWGDHFTLPDGSVVCVRHLQRLSRIHIEEFFDSIQQQQ